MSAVLTLARARVALMAALIVAVGVVAAPLRADIVERRGVEPPLVGNVTSVDDAGVTVRSESGAVHQVLWDRVRRVETEGADPALPRYLGVASDLWRARSRVERGDTALAEPLFERLFERYVGATHGTARVVAEGLLRCRLARGANALALIPALETARLQRAGIETDTYAALPPVIDTDTALCPQLAPAFVNSRALAKVERDLLAYDARGDAVVAAIGALYLDAIRRYLDAPRTPAVVVPDPAADEDHPGASLLAILVDCGDGDASVRESARQKAVRELAKAPPWARGWIHFATGASLLQEAGVGRRQRGMVELLHLPAQHRSALPYLGGLALAWVAEASRADGDTTRAKIVTEELTRSFPTHPVRSSPDAVFIPPIGSHD